MKAGKKPAPKPAPKSFEALTVAFAAGAVKVPDLEEIIGEGADEDLGKLWAHTLMALRRLQPAHVRKLLAFDRGALETAIQQTLPDHLSKRLGQYSDACVAHEALEREAAYAIGVEVGRRLAGRARTYRD